MSVPGVSRGPYRRKSVAERYWRHVDRSDADGCWPWTGHRNQDGYGRWQPERGGRFVMAHHTGYELAYGPVPPGMRVLHACDNPPCQRPAHLFAGTQGENVLDMVRKGRNRVRAWGEQHGHAKLTEADVREIRRRRAEGETYRSLAAAFRVNSQTAWNAVNADWRHVQPNE